MLFSILLLCGTTTNIWSQDNPCGAVCDNPNLDPVTELVFDVTVDQCELNFTAFFPFQTDIRITVVDACNPNVVLQELYAFSGQGQLPLQFTFPYSSAFLVSYARVVGGVDFPMGEERTICVTDCCGLNFGIEAFEWDEDTCPEMLCLRVVNDMSEFQEIGSPFNVENIEWTANGVVITNVADDQNAMGPCITDNNQGLVNFSGQTIVVTFTYNNGQCEGSETFIMPNCTDGVDCLDTYFIQPFDFNGDGCPNMVCINEEILGDAVDLSNITWTSTGGDITGLVSNCLTDENNQLFNHIGETLTVTFTYNNGACPEEIVFDLTCGGDELSVCGNIRTECGDGVALVDVFPCGVTTEDDGNYCCTNLTPGQNLIITPTKDAPINNGVDAEDIALIEAHIQGLVLLESPYQLIAADVNSDGNITALDLAFINGAIIEGITEFPNGTPSWRFIPEDFEFLDPLMNGWSPNFPEVITLINIMTSSAGNDFIGIKMGDVNCSANPAMLVGGGTGDEEKKENGGRRNSVDDQIAEVSIFPNPFSDQINITFPEMFTNGSIQLFNTKGELMNELKELKSTIDLAHLPTGIYYLRFKSNEGNFVQKIVKK